MKIYDLDLEILKDETLSSYATLVLKNKKKRLK